MCDVKIRRLGNVHRYSVECVLPTNLFHEKIFIFLWFWFAFLAAVTGVSLILWAGRISRQPARQFVKQQLHSNRRDNDVSVKKLRQFVDEYLRNDGVFVLRMIGSNTDTITVAELTNELWDNFRKKPRTDVLF